ncbi:MAG: 30S ribosomal protein S27e [Candidatus Aenigmarchaeota archaeon]|nr:30S ribosomal protein S27e [Candidatus Aenigmarchaeota archaeon]
MVVKLEPRSKFILVKCTKCKNEQIIFSNSSSVVKCLVCGSVLAEPTGGMADIKAKILKELN